MPAPCFNVINGGSHAGNALAFQEFMIVPVGASDMEDAMRMGSECYHGASCSLLPLSAPQPLMLVRQYRTALKSVINKKYGIDGTSLMLSSLICVPALMS